MTVQSLELLKRDADLRSAALTFGIDQEMFRNARDLQLKDANRYDNVDWLLQRAMHSHRSTLVGVAAFVVFLLCPYWLCHLVLGRPVIGTAGALLYLGITLNGYYLLVAAVEISVPRYVEPFDGITIAIDIIAFSLFLAWCRIIIPGVSSALRGALDAKLLTTRTPGRAFGANDGYR
jgi:hypothetical protein